MVSLSPPPFLIIQICPNGLCILPRANLAQRSRFHNANKVQKTALGLGSLVCHSSGQQLGVLVC